MNLSDQYNIGINLLVKGDALETFADFSKITSELTKKIDVLTISFRDFNKVLSSTMANFLSLDNGAEGFAARLSMVTKEMRSFSRANVMMKEEQGFFSKSANHLGKEAGREMGMAGKLGMGALMDMAFGPEGIVIVAGGYMAVKGFEAQNAYQRQLAQIGAQGFPGFAARANSAAMGAQLPMVTPTAYAAAINDALVVTKNQNAALQLAPTIAKMNAANTILGAKEGRQWTEEDSYKMARSAEILSHSRNPLKIEKTLQILQRAIEIEGFKLSPNDIYGYAKRNAAFASVQNQTAFLANVVGMQQAGGHSWGTMGRTFTNLMLRGQPFGTGKFAMMRQMKLGIMGSNFEPMDKNLLVSDPAEWILNKLLPLLNAHGFKTNAQLAVELPRLFPGTSANYIMQTIGIASKIQSVLKNVGHTDTIQGAFTSALNLPAGQVKNLSSAWTNLETAFGKLSSGPVIAGMEALTKFLNILTSLIRKSGSLFKYTETGILTNTVTHFPSLATIKSKAESYKSDVYLDSKKVGNVLWKKWHQMMNAPTSSGNHTHTNVALQQVGNNFNNAGRLP